MKTIENICYSGTQCLDLYLPERDTFDLFVFFHGGSLESGDKGTSSVKMIAPWLTARGIALASCNYRMYPDANYPDFVQDAAAAVHWLSHHVGAYGNCSRIFVGGSSAGAYLSMMLCFDARWYAAQGELAVPVCGYLHNAGQPTCHFNVLRERGIDRRRVIIDDSAPLYHIGTAAEYPPMMFVVSDNDMKGRFEQTQLVLASLRHFGYDQDKILYHLLEGKHCAHDTQSDEDGNPILGKLILELIQRF